jgi:hypothetical protein
MHQEEWIFPWPLYLLRNIYRMYKQTIFLLQSADAFCVMMLALEEECPVYSEY